MVNKVILLGRLGKDVETRNLESGNTVANFTLATSESYKNKNGEKVENTEWHNIVVWGKQAEIAARYLKKGSQIYLEGKITTRSWEKDGSTRYSTEIVANNFTMLGSPGGGQNDNNTSDNESGLPF